MKRSATFAILLFVSATATAQVVAPAGTIDVTLAVQRARIHAHTDATGTVRDDGPWNIDLRSVSTTLTVDYSVTDRLGLGLSVPYIRSRYQGPNPHPGVIEDDGSMHGSLQDLQLDARYALVRGEFLVTPFAGFRVPIRDYATMGHAAPGRGLREIEAGVSAGRHLLPLIPDAVVGANVSYTRSEAVEDIRVNRTNADVQLGYGLTPRLFVRGFAAWQRSHDGVDVPLPPSHHLFHHHDQLARVNHTRAGAGVSVAVTDVVTLHLGYAEILRSVNSHMGRSVSVGTNWRFMPRSRMQRRASVAPTLARHQRPISDIF
jgi:hypothetical protein